MRLKLIDASLSCPGLKSGGKMEEDQIFHRNCGEILRKGLDVEATLDYFISNYFCTPQSYRTFLLRDSILVEHIGFGRKIEIFKEICKKEHVDEERINKILEAIRFVQNIRNRVAHDEAFISDPKEGIRLQKRKSVQYKKDELKITDALVKEVEENRLFSIQEIDKIIIELSDPSRERNIEW